MPLARKDIEPSRWLLSRRADSPIRSITPRPDLVAAYWQLFNGVLAEEDASEFASTLKSQNDLLSLVLQDLLLAAQDHAGRGLVADYFCGLYPTLHFNAIAVRISSGTMILVDSGFIELISGATTLLVGMLSSDEGNGAVSPPLIDQESARVVFQSLVDACLDHQSVHIDRMPNLDEKRHEGAFIRLVTETLYFAVAHELAHGLLGHFEPSAKVVDQSLPEWLRSAAIPVWPMSLELQADDVAMELLLKVPTFAQPVDYEEPYSAAVLFGQLALALEEGSERRAGGARRGQRSHPHPVQRMGDAIARNHPDGWRAQLPLCDGFLRSFRYLRGYPQIAARDAGAIEILLSFARQADIDRLSPLLPIPTAEAKLTVGFGEQLATFLAESLPSARAAVAALACDYLTRFASVSSLSQRLLGYTYWFFAALYLGDEPAPEAREFDECLRRAIPELDEILDFYATFMDTRIPE